jgi:hypothetical protein
MDKHDQPFSSSFYAHVQKKIIKILSQNVRTSHMQILIYNNMVPDVA